MKTITFYSYKGGVGRSLALANIATRLSEFNKKVCLIDFDLEAPGLPYKFRSELNNLSLKQGLVDYIYHFTSEGYLPKSISEFVYPIKISSTKEPIYLLPAGNVDSKDYWKKLSSINWYELLYENSAGLSFFLDLKEKIRKEIAPDFLLIDSRTGISEMSGISISLLADEVVIIAANNKENFLGARKIIHSLSNPSNLILDRSPKINLVLSRIPFTNEPYDRAKEQFFIAKMKKDFSDIYNDEIIIIHSDRELEENESLKIESETENGKSTISNDYLKLFEKLTRNDLSIDELNRFAKIKEANRLFQLSFEKENPTEQIKLLTQAIELDKENTEFYISRAEIYFSIKDYDSSLKDLRYVLSIDNNNYDAIANIIDLFLEINNLTEGLDYCNKLIQLEPNDAFGYYNRALVYTKLGKEEEELKDYQKALELDPTDEAIYNNLSSYYNNKGDYNKAKDFIYKALQINPNSGISYATLAEISANMNDINAFYLNLELALINSEKDEVKDGLETEQIYKQFFSDERFKKLLEKYKISLSAIDESS